MAHHRTPGRTRGGRHRGGNARPRPGQLRRGLVRRLDRSGALPFERSDPIIRSFEGGQLGLDLLAVRQHLLDGLAVFAPETLESADLLLHIRQTMGIDLELAVSDIIGIFFEHGGTVKRNFSVDGAKVVPNAWMKTNV